MSIDQVVVGIIKTNNQTRPILFGNDNHDNSDESEYNDPLNGIYSQYYEEEEDNESEILKRNSSNQTQIQNPKRQKR